MRASFYAGYVLFGSSLLGLGCDRVAAPPTSAPVPAVASPAPVAPVALAQAKTAAPSAAAAGKPGHFGAPLSDAPALTAQAVLAEPTKYDDKDVKLTGQVSAACAKKGCWMTLGGEEPGGKRLRVTFKDYGFFVPTDCTGKTATVEGHLKVTTLSIAQAQHYADDAAKAGAPAKKITEPQHEVALVATGVELL
jgi:hypothetical protein